MGTGLLLALAAPPLAAWPLAFVALVPLFAVLPGRGLAARVGLSTAASAALGLTVASGPTGIAASRFLGVPLWQGLAFTNATALVFAAASFALFAGLAGDPARQRPALWIARAGAAFSVGEFARSSLLTGFPWLLTAHALAPRPELAQLAALGGSGLLGWWVVSLNAALAGLLVRDTRREAAWVLAGLVLAGAGAALGMPPAGAGPGAVRPSSGDSPPPGALRVLLLQPALPEAVWNDGARAAQTLALLTEQSLREARGRVDLVVWPENALKVLLPANRALVSRATSELAPVTDHLLLGAPRYDPAAPQRQFNAAHLFDAEGRALGAHDKVRLVPFLEYRLFGLGGPDAVLAPGDAPATLPLGEHALGPLVCYEVLFSRIARAQVRDGAGLLFNLSNDAWFGGTGGAEQHFAAAVLLAIELRRPVLRSTPTGVTGAVDAAGRVVARLPPDEPGALRIDVWPSSSWSGYAHLGNAIPWLALAATLPGAVLDFSTFRRRGRA